MSARDQSRRFDRTTATFDLPPATDIVRAGREVCFVPNWEVRAFNREFGFTPNSGPGLTLRKLTLCANKRTCSNRIYRSRVYKRAAKWGERMKADNRLAVFCLVVLSIIIAGIMVEKFWDCRLKGGAEEACLFTPAPYTPP
jgi:hypothetical protein